MPGSVVGTSLNLGYAGKISRNQGAKISARFSKSIITDGAETLPNIPFGFGVVLNTDNTYSKFGATGSGVAAATAANFAGVAVAEVKQNSVWISNSNGEYTPAQPVDVIAEGSVMVKCMEGTPTAGGAVYIMTVAGDNAAVGEFVATATPAGAGATAVQLTNCEWTTGKVDANDICEMTIMRPVKQ